MDRKSCALFACAILCLAACEEYDAPTAARSGGPTADRPPTTTVVGTPGPMVPPPPDRISERQVFDELAAIPSKDPIASSDFNRLLELFGSAKTDVAYKYLSAEALHIALEQKGGASATMLRRLIRAQATANVTPGFTIGPQASAECHVDFDDPQWLADLPDQAQATFATYYAEPCGSYNAVRIEPMQYGHFHLAYEDPTIDCIDENGLFGRGEPGNCTALADPSVEPRRLISHDASQVIRITRLSVLGIPSTFSMVSFVNYGGEPVKFRYRKGAVWYQWGSLAGQTTWDVSAYVVDVDEVQITHPSVNAPCGPDWEAGGPGGGCPPGGGPFALDNFRINP